MAYSTPTNSQCQHWHLSIPETIHKLKNASIPFGQHMLDEIVAQLSPLSKPSCVLTSNAAKVLLHKLGRVNSFFTTWCCENEFSWIKSNKRIRYIMLKCLFTESMDELEVEKWIHSLYLCIKRVARNTPATQLATHEERLHTSQVLIDVMHDLIMFMNRAPCRQEMFHEYHRYLDHLCQRFCLAPTVFFISRPIDVNWNDYHGIGATANVFRGTIGNKIVAVKQFRIFGHVKQKDKKKFLREALVLRLVCHPHILPFRGINMTENVLEIVSDWMENGDIATFTKANPKASKADLLEQVADALHFLKQNKIVHGDLKAANVLITSDCKACISDLGAAVLTRQDDLPSRVDLPPQKFITPQRRNLGYLNFSVLCTISPSVDSSKMSTFSQAGTYRYMSPERLNPEKYGKESSQATYESDIFSFAMLVYEVYAGRPPFDKASQFGVVPKILSGERPEKPMAMPITLWELVTDCWHDEANMRPTIFEAYSLLASLPL